MLSITITCGYESLVLDLLLKDGTRGLSMSTVRESDTGKMRRRFSDIEHISDRLREELLVYKFTITEEP